MDKIAQAYLGIVTGQIDESLTFKQKDKADSMKENGHDFYREKFLEQHPVAKAMFEGGSKTEGSKYRARFPISITETKGNPDPDVKDHLHSLGYKTDHDLYHKGLATKETTVGNPDAGIPYSVKHVEHKIGGLLDKHNAPDDIKKKFVNDKFRQGATTKDYDMILTGDHRDIFGGSTGRGWKSCAAFEPTDKFPRAGSGPAAKVMNHEINNHTHHVYLVPRGGNVDTDAIARTSLKLHKDVLTGHTTLFPEGTVHGDAPAKFIDHAKELSSRVFDSKPGALYIKNQDVYHDGGKRLVTAGPVSPAALDAAWKTTKPKDDLMRSAIMGHVDEEAKYTSKGLKDVAKSLKTLKTGVASGDFVKATEGLWHAHLNIPNTAQHRLWDHPVISEAQEKIPAMFDLHGHGHIHALAHMPNTSLGNFQNRTASQIAPAKTIDDYHKLTDLHERGLKQSGSYGGIKIDPKHTMGKDPMKAIIDHHVSTNTLDRNTFSTAYHSTSGLGKSRGNYYDQAVHFEGEGVPGMSDIVHHAANNISNLHGSNWVTPRDEDIASTYKAMKPDTRARMASINGDDHKAIIKKHRAYFDARDARFAENKSKVSED